MGTAIFLSVPILPVLLPTGNYAAPLGWAISLGAAMFGFGAGARALQAQDGSRPAARWRGTVTASPSTVDVRRSR
ncbi:hypothetical protein D8Y22_16210 [Salinadaptatus halalkaliphilus]|uniref:Uncharacterized protein n=1 Tax=Salinadaptatus halalkaliphilus TaxID=2419781 RepID=A0A4V3VL18_9EURY|nr:hypothetical protein [Salinadaptatus halalkaliphilus]THE63867.1 hypothetical protein D8Y22_16210 [Salinadaptatus halalkaliphilus]